MGIESPKDEKSQDVSLGSGGPKELAAMAAVADYSEEDHRRLVRRIDCILMPLLCVSYGLQFIDKQSLSFGVLFNLRDDLHLAGTNYASLTTVFYMGYLFAQYPYNFLIQKYNVGYMVAACYLFWGIGVMLFVVCTNFGGVATLRWFIGMAEAIVTPAFLFITSSFYTRKETFFRVLIFTSMNTFFPCFSSVLMYLLGKYSLDNPETLHGWKTINLLLGGFSIVWAPVIFWFINTPENVRWLTAAQKLQLKARLVEGKGNSNEVHTFDWSQAAECAKDPQVYAFVLITFLGSFANSGITTFGGLILTGLGLSSLQATYYQIPAWAAGFLLLATLPINWYWPKFGIYTLEAAWSAGSFLVWAAIPTNVAGRTKRSVVSGSVFVAYAVGNAVGGQAYKTSQAPVYRDGLVADAVCFGLATFCIMLLWLYYVRENKSRDAAATASGRSLEELEEEGKKLGELDTTDLRNPHFRYIR